MQWKSLSFAQHERYGFESDEGGMPVYIFLGTQTRIAVTPRLAQE